MPQSGRGRGARLGEKMALHNDDHCGDGRRVILIKSLATNNRFYVLIPPESGLRNADTVPSIPEDLLLGIAYPCLEDGLNDFAVIRTTYETLEFFPDDESMRNELMDIIEEARASLVRRLTELRDRIADGRAHFLGTDLAEFKSYALDIVDRGYPRRNLDAMMKLNVFSAVAEAEGHADGSEPLYNYEFRDPNAVPRLSQLSPREFVAAIFSDVLESVQDDANYVSRYAFDRNVFQKFIAVMFVNYATTDPIFYGINKADYGVSADREMDGTPLYLAVGRELRQIEAERVRAAGVGVAAEEGAPEVAIARPESERLVQLPGTLINEDVLLAPISAICASAGRLARSSDHETAEIARIVLAEASRLVQELKRLNIVSPFAHDPGSPILPAGERQAERPD